MVHSHLGNAKVSILGIVQFRFSLILYNNVYQARMCEWVICLSSDLDKCVGIIKKFGAAQNV